MTPVEKATYLALLKQQKLGYRTNKYIEAIRPAVRPGAIDGLHPKQRWFLGLSDLEVFFGGAAGGSKILYDDGEVLTPFGFKAGRDVRVGDLVNNPDGSVAKIVQVHPRREHQVWRVHFHDGTHTDVANQHLWLVWRSGKRKKIRNQSTFGEDAAEVVETQTLKVWVDQAKDQVDRGIRPNWPCIPICQPQRFNSARRHVSQLDPYLLGAWLGDGHCSTNIGLTSADVGPTQHLLQSLGYDWSEYQKPGTPAKQFLFRGETARLWQHELSKFGLDTKSAHSKFIPDEFKLGSLQTRLAVLQGLMDTDGTVDERGQLYFGSTSKQLAEDTAFIVRSLGGTATLTVGPAGYRDKNGTHIECRDCWHLYIKLPNEKDAFQLERKRVRASGTSLLYRRVVNIEILEERKAGRCITVSHPNGLYITNDFIVTHNSDSLLLAALQYVDVPGYAAIMFRKSYADLTKAGALMDRASKWLGKFTEVNRTDGGQKYTFPSGAKLEFGYLDAETDCERYQSAEYQFIGFDEVSQIAEQNFLYLFSRGRRLIGSNIPIRIRAASNPGGTFGEWVKRRFIPDKYLRASVQEQFSRIWEKIEQCDQCGGTCEIFDDIMQQMVECYYCEGKGIVNRLFVPARLEDNPSVDKVAYKKALAKLPYKERMQLEHGRWDIAPSGLLFKQEWVRYYERRGDHIEVILDEGRRKVWSSEDIDYFMTADTASKLKTMNDYTVFSIWAYHRPSCSIALVHNVRGRIAVPTMVPLILRLYKQWRCQYIIIEDASSGIGVIQDLKTERGQGINVVAYSPGSVDPVSRATDAIIRMEGQQIFFPADNPYWMGPFLSEVMGFPDMANEGGHDDCVSSLTIAAWWIANHHRIAHQHGGAVPEVTEECPVYHGDCDFDTINAGYYSDGY